MSNATFFKRGVPYGPDVKRLYDAFPTEQLVEGTILGRDELAKILQTRVGTGRYYGVLNAWARDVRSRLGLYLKWISGVGLKVLAPTEVLEHGEKTIFSGMRKTSRGVRVLAYVDRPRLDEKGQRRLDHQVRVAEMLAGTLRDAKKQMAFEVLPVASLPKRAGV